MRAIRPRLSGSGRPRQGRMPSAARASSRAPSTSASGASRRRGRRKRRSTSRWQRSAALAPRVQLARQRIGRTVTSVPAAAAFGRGGEHGAGTQLAVRLAGGPAGDADIDGRRVGRRPRDLSRSLDRKNSPAPLRHASRGAEGERPIPRHPARPTTASTAGLLARGSPPVTAFPGEPSGFGLARACRLQLRGQLRIRNAPVPHRIPYWLSHERPSNSRD